MNELKVKLMSGRSLMCGGIISALMSYAIIMGAAFHSEESHPLKNMGRWGVVLLLALGLYVLLIMSWEFFHEKCRISNRVDVPAKSLRREFFIVFMILILCWLPYWLAAFPGFFTYDASKEFVQAYYQEVSYQARFPLLHSLLLRYTVKVCLKIFGNFQSGIACFCLIHMFLCAAVLSYESVFLHRLTGKRWLLTAACIYGAFTPTIALFSSCSNSTVFGSLVAVFFLIRFYEVFFMKNLEKISVLEFLVLSVLTCHLRSAFYLLYLGLFIAQLFVKENLNKRLILMVCGLLLSIMFDKTLAFVVHAEPGPVTESLNLPIQQLSMVYVKEGENAFTKEEYDELTKYFAIQHFNLFSPLIADPVKLGMNDDACKQDITGFFWLWLKVGVRYPEHYLNAAHYLSYQAWYPFCEPDGYTSRNYVESDYCSDYFNMIIEGPAEHHSIFPAFFERIREFSTMTSIHSIPVIGVFCTIGWQYFMLLYAAGYLIYLHEKKFKILLLAELVYFLFALMAPLVLVRYFLILFYAFPLVLAAVFGGIQHRDKK